MKHPGMLMEGRRLMSVALACAVATLVTSACSSEPSVPEGPWAESIRAAQGRLTSDFQKEAFADGVISREEYIEALDRWVSCMYDAGYTVALEPQDGYFIYSMNAAQGLDATDLACRVGTADEIEPIYVGMLQDPLNRTGPEATRDCLIAGGLLDPSVTVAEVTDGFGPIVEGTSTLVDNNDPDVTGCVGNPYSAPLPTS